jgi:hypothetical protein
MLFSLYNTLVIFQAYINKAVQGILNNYYVIYLLIIRENYFNPISPLLLDKLNKILDFCHTFILLVMCIGKLHTNNFVI